MTDAAALDRRLAAAGDLLEDGKPRAAAQVLGECRRLVEGER